MTEDEILVFKQCVLDTISERVNLNSIYLTISLNGTVISLNNKHTCTLNYFYRTNLI